MMSYLCIFVYNLQYIDDIYFCDTHRKVLTIDISLAYYDFLPCIRMFKWLFTVCQWKQKSGFFFKGNRDVAMFSELLGYCCIHNAGKGMDMGRGAYS